MTLKQLVETCKNTEHDYSGFYCKGELFINDAHGNTVFNKYMDQQDAEELCGDLDLTLEEV